MRLTLNYAEDTLAAIDVLALRHDTSRRAVIEAAIAQFAFLDQDNLMRDFFQRPEDFEIQLIDTPKDIVDR